MVGTRIVELWVELREGLMGRSGSCYYIMTGDPGRAWTYCVTARIAGGLVRMETACTQKEQRERPSAARLIANTARLRPDMDIVSIVWSRSSW